MPRAGSSSADQARRESGEAEIQPAIGRGQMRTNRHVVRRWQEEWELFFCIPSGLRDLLLLKIQGPQSPIGIRIANRSPDDEMRIPSIECLVLQ